MATSAGCIECVREQVGGTGTARRKKMFGDRMVYVDDKPILLVCYNTVLVKILPCLDALMANAETGSPYEGAKEHYVLDTDNAPLAREVAGALLPVTAARAKKSSKMSVSEVTPLQRHDASELSPLKRLMTGIIASLVQRLLLNLIDWYKPLLSTWMSLDSPLIFLASLEFLI